MVISTHSIQEGPRILLEWGSEGSEGKGQGDGAQIKKKRTSILDRN